MISFIKRLWSKPEPTEAPIPTPPPCPDEPDIKLPPGWKLQFNGSKYKCVDGEGFYTEKYDFKFEAIYMAWVIHRVKLNNSGKWKDCQ